MPSAYFNSPDSDTLTRLGFKLLKGGAHTSRTMMLAELETLLRQLDAHASAKDYTVAVVEHNALGKETVSSRKKSLSHLKELYALDPRVPLFAVLRVFHGIAPDSLPLLALLTALAREPLLRASASAVLPVPEGEGITPQQISVAIEKDFPGSYSPKSLLSISQNCASSWAQAGHLAGRAKKMRTRPQPTPAVCALALWLGEAAGHRGAVVFDSPWCRAAGLDPDRARALGFEAHRSGLLNLRAIGEVVEVRFPNLPATLHPAA